MGKTYRRGKSFKPKSEKDFVNFKKSNKFKNWDENPMKKLTDIDVGNLDISSIPDEESSSL